MSEYPEIAIIAYDPRWPDAYETVSGDIARALGHRLVAIEHIGSTAVPGLAAKPIIDIIAAVEDFPASIRSIVEPLETIGFAYVDKGRVDRHFFRRGAWGRGTHHLHVVEFAGDDWRRQIFFRDWLRSHRETAHRYQQLKENLAREMIRDRPGYRSAKTDFIRSVLAHDESRS